jgi:murein endopeptidase
VTRAHLGLVVVLLTIAGTAHAERDIVQRGETLEHVAQRHGCTVEAIERANGLKTTLVKAGTAIEVPTCTLTSRARSRATRKADATASDDAKARQALAVIDGASWIADPDPPRPTPPHEVHRDAESVGAPWNGRLEHAAHLETGDGYEVRRPSRAYGAEHVVEHLRHAIAEVRALYPDVHTLAIGDLSAEHGGKISDHHSHQSGLDVDVGFYFTHVPAGYPAGFAAADANLDLEATWALLAAFARTAALDDGVSMIFLDYGIQRRLYDWARKRGTPDDELEFLFQYPRGSDALAGLVRHWPEHANHLHVRFKPAR